VEVFEKSKDLRSMDDDELRCGVVFVWCLQAEIEMGTDERVVTVWWCVRWK
jgi:hypothetical protein